MGSKRLVTLLVSVTLSAFLVIPPGSAARSAMAVTTPAFSRPALKTTTPARSGPAKPALPEAFAAPAPTSDPAPAPASSGSPLRVSAAAPDAGSSLPLVDPLAPAVPGELVVVLDEGASAAVSERALEVRGAVVERVPGDDGVLVARTPLGVSGPVFNVLAQQAPGVAWVQPNYIYRQAEVPSDPLYSQQWALPKIGAPAAWDVTHGSNSVVVAVVDTGVDYTHPDLAARVDTASDYDFVNGDSDAYDDNEHGTHVAGIVAATGGNGIGIVGVAPRVRILPVKVLDSKGSGDSVGVAAGIRYAADNGAKIINLSLATSVEDAIMRSAVAYAHAQGCVVVAAAGNEGFSTGADYPARYPDVIGVGAVDRSGIRATFSNYGTGVDVWAPGVDILSTVPGGTYERWNGTSMASPVVAGVAALVASLYSTWGPDTPDQIRTRVLSTAQSLGSLTLVRADRALVSSDNGPDDSIPGMTLPSSPAPGTLNEFLDVHDVYRVYLGEGQRFVATLDGDVGTDFDLSLFPPGATSLDDLAPRVDWSWSPMYPDAIDYTVPLSGWYYIDVVAAEGEGSYTLYWERTGSSNDNLPGALILGSPFVDSLDSAADIVDVYQVPVAEGQQLTVSMAGPDGTDYDLWLYGPGSTSIDADAPLLKRESPYASELLRYVAAEGGTYSVVVYAYSGSGQYQLEWSSDTFDPDDNIPGVELSSSTTATVGGLTDTDDVYKVFLQAGQSVDVMLSGLTGDLGAPKLYFFDPASTNVDTDFWVAEVTSEDSVKSLSYTAMATGYHYVDVYSGGDPGQYRLEWTPSEIPDDNIPGEAASSSRLVGDLGVTTDTDDVYTIHAKSGQQIVVSLRGTALEATASTDFDLYMFAPGSTDARRDTPVAMADGAAYPKTITIDATQTADYYLLVHAFAGEGTYTLDWSMKPHVAISGPYAPSSVTRKRYFTVYGYVAPRHSSGTYLVDLRFYKKTSGVYVYYKTVKAKRYYYSSTKTKYSTSTTLPTSGTWRVRAYHSDAAHAPTYSGYDYITVK